VRAAFGHCVTQAARENILTDSGLCGIVTTRN
jgi:hypothetical protein